jgi:hypothetical protein
MRQCSLALEIRYSSRRVWIGLSALVSGACRDSLGPRGGLVDIVTRTGLCLVLLPVTPCISPGKMCICHVHQAIGNAMWPLAARPPQPEGGEEPLVPECQRRVTRIGFEGWRNPATYDRRAARSRRSGCHPGGGKGKKSGGILQVIDRS